MNILPYFKALFLLLLTSLAFKGFAQESIYVDERDGQVYELLHFGGSTWFASNLRFETENSWCKEENPERDCAHGNYYYNYELDHVCPTGWHVSTWEDWEKSLPYVYQSLGVNPDSLELFPRPKGGLYVDGVNLLNDSLGLKLHPAGWVQGKKLDKRFAADIWLKDPRDNRRHLHIGRYNFVWHSHKSNIDSRPRATRRFSVRCVKDK